MISNNVNYGQAGKPVIIAGYARSGQGWLSYMLSYILNAKFTFNAVPNRNAASLYYMNYFVSFILSILLLKFFRENLDWGNYIIGVLPMPFVVSWNFIITYFIFKLD